MSEVPMQSKLEGKTTKQPVISEVKDLGRKARERLEEERKKRREIVRLNEEPAYSLREYKKSKNDVVSPSRDPSKKRRSGRPGALKRKAVQRIQAPKEQRVDLKIPDILHIPAVKEEFKSNVVRLHGLPLDVRPEHIKNFFSGIELERIFALPKFDVLIPEWDAKTTNRNDQQNDKTSISDSSLRVFVKFHSTPVAHLASQRSGEILTIEGKLDEKIRACIAIIQISKIDAPYLLRRMGIDGKDGVALRETVAGVESNLHAMVKPILWTSLLEDLNLTTQSTKKDTMQLRLKHRINPLELEAYQLFASHHNELADHYESLVGPTLLPLTFEYDSGLSRDPVTCLTCQAANILLVEMRRIQQILFRARIERWERRQHESRQSI